MLISYAAEADLASFLPVSGQEIANLAGSRSDHSVWMAREGKKRRARGMAR